MLQDLLKRHRILAGFDQGSELQLTEGKITDLVDDQRPRSSSDTYLQQLHLDSSHFGTVS